MDSGPPGPAPAVWWTDPAKLMAFFIIPLYVAIYFAPELLGRSAVHLEFTVYWTPRYFFLGLAFLVSALVGTLIGRQLHPSRGSIAASAPIHPMFLEFLALAAIVAYLIWFRGLFMKPWVLLQSLSQGFIATTRLENRTIPGVTTLTQLGVAYVILYLDRVLKATDRPLPRRFRVYFWALVVLAALRVFVWAERLALLELLVPVVVGYFVVRGLPGQPGVRRVVQLAPLLGIGALLVYFGATEYFRSWHSHYQFQQDGFVHFVTKRVLTYYFTALNNGAGLLTIMDWPTYRYEYLLSGIYRFPLLFGAALRFTLDAQPTRPDFLERYADPEFTNMSGIFTVFYDIGVGGGLLYAALWGGACGYLYNSCRVGAGVGRVLYPLVYISLLEVFRFPYLSESRAIPAIVFLLLGYWLAREHIGAREPGYVRLRGRRDRLVNSGGWAERVRSSLRRR